MAYIGQTMLTRTKPNWVKSISFQPERAPSQPQMVGFSWIPFTTNPETVLPCKWLRNLKQGPPRQELPLKQRFFGFQVSLHKSTQEKQQQHTKRPPSSWSSATISHRKKASAGSCRPSLTSRGSFLSRTWGCLKIPRPQRSSTNNQKDSAKQLYKHGHGQCVSPLLTHLCPNSSCSKNS